MRVLINSSAGTAIAMSREQLSEAIEVPLKAAGHDVEFEVVAPEEFERCSRAGRGGRMAMPWIIGVRRWVGSLGRNRAHGHRQGAGISFRSAP